MLNLEDFKIFLREISPSILIAKPIFDENNSFKDFSIEFINKSFENFTKGIVKENQLFSEFSKKLSPNIPWFEISKESVDYGKKIVKNYYSDVFGKWIKIVMDRIGIYTALTIIDISKDKENENILKSQNEKLEELTEEITKNQISLNMQIKGMQTLNDQLLFAAYHDSLTNLYNRVWLSTAMKDTAKDCKNSNNKFALLFMDIDNMKDINDTKGHNAGDEIIRKAATIFRKFASDDIIPTRFGGDEFIILCKNIDNKESVISLGRTLLLFFNSEGIKLSGGVSIFPDDSKDIDDILKFADMAKADVKKNGKNNVYSFQSIMQEKLLQKITMEVKLSKAINDRYFNLYFQPQYNIKTNKLRGFEALLRWYDEELGWISPEKFIPLAEETRLVIPLGDWVINTAIKTLAKWEKEFNFKGIMSINVSPIQFNKPDFIEQLLDKINKYKASPEKIELEITEGMLIDNVEEVTEKLNIIKNMGIGISLDDFGTGYSSLRYLQMLPLTTLKIDKSFITNINSAKGIEANITESIINLVSKMGLDTIAEGVENDSQLKTLDKINCQTVQGFLKGKPMPENQCEELLKIDSVESFLK